MLDGNAIAGILYDLFSVEMTLAPVECAACGSISAVGRLLAFVESPGYVIRCPDCQGIIMRLAVTPGEIYLDVRGASYLCIPRKDQA
ncbi:MAG: hypothetical protein C3F13_00140 [Anaerolineales bacterium]|nr:hypothetical protein [Anaerolineae bacterium]PWB56897.1 MAG: hypothetical protein C3F13_00140 [Anaerolineales bacterium]